MLTCCFAGREDVPDRKMSFLEHRVDKEVELAIGDGFRVFLCGMETIGDFLFAQSVIEQRERFPHLYLEAALPCAARLEEYGEVVASLLRSCNGISCALPYRSSDRTLRDRYMVGCAQRIIAAVQGKERGDLGAALRFARGMGLEIRKIRL